VELVAIMGSPNGMKGNTGRVLESLLKASGAEVTLFCLGDLSIAPCIACDACHRTGECSIRDDFQSVLAAMVAADAIVLASPNYIMSVTAQMKALFDRCCGPIHTQALDGKYGAAVVTSGSQESAEVEDHILRFLRVTGCYTVGSVGTSAAELFDGAERARVLGSAADLGRRLASAVGSRQPMPEQEPARSAFRERMRQLVTSQRDRWTYEYEWWQEHERSA